jgi:hypothetical protein
MYAARYQARTPVIDEDDERYWCPDCDLKTGAEFRLKKHLEKRGPLLAKFECPECSAWWTSAHAYCQNYQVRPPAQRQAFLFLRAMQECKRCGAEAYPFDAQYKTVGTQNQGDPTKRHMAELCERCTSGLTCSAADAEDRARIAGEEAIKTGPTQYKPPARPGAVPRAAPVCNPWQVPSPVRYTPPPPARPDAVPRAAPVRNPWQVPSPVRYTPPPPSQPAPMPRAAPETNPRQSATSSGAGTWSRADHLPQQTRTTAPDTNGSFCVLF